MQPPGSRRNRIACCSSIYGFASYVFRWRQRKMSGRQIESNGSLSAVPQTLGVRPRAILGLHAPTPRLAPVCAENRLALAPTQLVEIRRSHLQPTRSSRAKRSALAPASLQQQTDQETDAHQASHDALIQGIPVSAPLSGAVGNVAIPMKSTMNSFLAFHR